ncbi:putative acyl-CoA dehydrogenase [Gordonia effusa NBRC 100432]|uniref:Putative acyl-CoA dehydrogenase n=1 Tax=Gordonia effusa NBRC 100432 TaxID=1077974 RepID=H0QYY2_9ACTN|nr:acyl-CoA dehydrogenase family protein [Gordonia effusa]GAB18033.1 putative acyl-CoA dehydrogenase [Gordonia effusa NBRC 100432]
MNDLDPVFVSTVRDVFARLAASADLSPVDRWQQLDDIGLARLLAPASSGGSEAGWREVAVVLETAARQSVTTGIVGSDVLAGWLLRRAGLSDDAVLRGAGLIDDAGREIAVERVDGAESVVTLAKLGEEWTVSAAHQGDAEVDAHTGELFMLRGALCRSIQVAGALAEINNITTEHVTTRTQFGRPLAKFQALQQVLADSAAQTALTAATVDAAVATADAYEAGATALERLRFDVAVARSCAGHAASTVVRNAHQTLGAIGTTVEHRLHRYTMPALSWCAEFGSTQHWDDVVAQEAERVGADGLWELIVG